MNFSKTTEYALRILSYMAMDETRLYRTKEIYQKLNIPFRYLRRQMTNLTKSGLIDSVQGNKGGYKISRRLDEIALMDIIKAVGDTPLEDNCFFGFQGCAFTTHCVMHEKWTAIRENIKQVLETTKLSDLKSSWTLLSEPGLNK